MTRTDERCEAGHCITCSDEGLPMRVLGQSAGGLTPCLAGDGARHEVMTELVGVLTAGDLVLVHAGVALARLDDGVSA